MLIKHYEISKEISFVDGLIDEEQAVFDSSKMRYETSDLKILIDYRSDLINKMNSGFDAHRPGLVQNIISKQAMAIMRIYDMK